MVTLRVDRRVLEFVLSELKGRAHKHLAVINDPEKAQYKRDKAELKLARINEFTTIVKEQCG